MNNSVFPPKLTVIFFCLFPFFLFAQEDFLPSPDELFAPIPVQQAPQSTENQNSLPIETFDDLPPIQESSSVEFTPDSKEPEILTTPVGKDSDKIEQSQVSELPAIKTQEPVKEVSVATSLQQTPYSYPVSVTPEHNGWAISVHGGSNLFYGDLRIYPLWPAKQYNNERKWAFGASLDKEFNKYLQLRGTVLYGTLSGTKRKYESGLPANLYFDASLLEYSAALKVTFAAEQPFSFYVYAGLGFVHFRTQQKDLRTNEVLASYGYKGSEKSTPTIETMAPVGFGFNYKITDNVSANIDISLRVVNTDKLDATISNPSPFFQDMYGYSAIGLTYTFGRKQVNAVPSMVQAPPVIEEIVEAEIVEEVVEVEPEPEPELPIFEEVVIQEIIEPEPVVEPIETPEPTPIITQEEIVKEEPITETVEGVPYQNVPAHTDLVYRVQILAVKTAKDNKVAQLHKLYQLNETIYEEHSGVWYKYTVGSFATLQQANEHRENLVKKGLKDCFVVPYYNGNRITLQQARDLK